MYRSINIVLQRAVANVSEKKAQTLKSVSEKKVEKSPQKSAESIAKEKELLQKLAEQYALKIERLKMTQSKKVGKENKTPQNVLPKPIPRLEKIELGGDTTDDDKKEDKSDEKPSKRRRSLLDLNPSTKPNLGETPCSPDTDKNKAIKPQEEKRVKFSMPNKQQVKKLKLLMVSWIQ